MAPPPKLCVEATSSADFENRIVFVLRQSTYCKPFNIFIINILNGSEVV